MPSIVLGIRAKLILAILLFLTIMLSFVWWWVYSSFQHHLKDRVAAEQYSYLQITSRDIDNEFRTAQKMLRILSIGITPEIITNKQKALYILDDRLSMKMIFDAGLFIFDKNGHIAATSSQEPVGKYQCGEETYFIDTIKNKTSVFSDPILLNPKINHPVILITYPILNKQKVVIGVVAGAIDLLNDDGFLRSRLNTRVGKTGYMYICNSERTYIYHQDKEWIMAKNVKHGIDKLFDRAIYENFEGGGESENLKGIKIYSTFTHLKSTGWILASNYLLDDLYIPINEFRLYFMFFIIAILIGSSLVIYFISSRITHNLETFAGYIRSMDVNGATAMPYKIKSGDEVAMLANSFNRLIDQLFFARDQLDGISRTDPLTGLYNRRHFDQKAASLFTLSSQQENPVTLLQIDIDKFKRVNDTHGHEVGDYALKHIAGILTGSVRTYDMVVRWGGEEFLILMPFIPPDEAYSIAERIRKTVEETEVDCGVSGVNGLRLTISIGLDCAYSYDTFHQAIENADIALYQAKHNGRNRVEIYNANIHSISPPS